jgi:hypothetical protein
MPNSISLAATRDQTRARTTVRRDIILLFGLALALRLSVSWCVLNINHGDELFQGFEQAHRLTFGYGVIPWEWRVGARSWLLPGALSLLLDIARRFTDDPLILTFVLKATLGALSCITVIVAYMWGARFSRLHALLAALVLAIWFEFIYFACRALGEVVSTTFIILGLYFATAPSGDSRRSWFIAGLSLGLASVLRFHLSPAAAVVAVTLARSDIRGRWLPALLGSLLPLALLGVTDFLTWGAPFHSVFENFGVNIIENRSLSYGVKPAWWYLAVLIGDWGGAFFAIAALSILGARRAPALLVFSIVYLLSHMLVQHKEYRFLYPALTCLLLLAAFGSGELLQRVRSPFAAIAVGAIVWVGTSMALAVQPRYQALWERGRPVLEATVIARNEPATCGLGFSGIPWDFTGGYTYLHRNIPQFFVTQDDKDWSQFNVALIAGRDNTPPSDQGFSLESCVDSRLSAAVSTANEYWPRSVCVYRRAGKCALGGPVKPVNAYLQELDQ